MNNYLELSKLYYQKANIEEELNKRLENPCVYKTSLYIIYFANFTGRKSFKGSRIVFFTNKKCINVAR